VNEISPLAFRGESPRRACAALSDILIKSTWRGLINPHPCERVAFKSLRALEYRMSITRSFVNSRSVRRSSICRSVSAQCSGRSDPKDINPLVLSPSLSLSLSLFPARYSGSTNICLSLNRPPVRLSLSLSLSLSNDNAQGTGTTLASLLPAAPIDLSVKERRRRRGRGGGEGGGGGREERLIGFHTHESEFRIEGVPSEPYREY
jgi:hypothetical protein